METSDDSRSQRNNNAAFRRLLSESWSALSATATPSGRSSPAQAGFSSGSRRAMSSTSPRRRRRRSPATMVRTPPPTRAAGRRRVRGAGSWQSRSLLPLGSRKEKTCPPTPALLASATSRAPGQAKSEQQYGPGRAATAVEQARGRVSFFLKRIPVSGSHSNKGSHLGGNLVLFGPFRA